MTSGKETKNCVARCVAFLQSQDIEVSTRIREPATRATLTAYEEEFNLQFSPRFAAFYLECTDGLSIEWDAPASDAFCVVDIATLTELRLLRQQWVNFDHHSDQKDFRYVKDRELAERSWQAVEH